DLARGPGGGRLAVAGAAPRPAARGRVHGRDRRGRPAAVKDQVFAVGYRRLPGGRPRRWAPWPIARTALAAAWRKRSTQPAQVLAQRLAGSRGELMEGLMRGIVGDVHSTLASFIGVQMLACAFLLAMVAAGLVAEDRRTGAMELYFSRPLRRHDYVAGKLLAA